MRWLALLFAVSCDFQADYIYTAFPYNSARMCFDDALGLDVMAAPDPGTACPARCLVVKDDASPQQVYVSQHCAPYPVGYDTSGTDPRCAPAIEALNRNDHCFADGGSTNPLSEAGVDAATD